MGWTCPALQAGCNEVSTPWPTRDNAPLSVSVMFFCFIMFTFSVFRSCVKITAGENPTIPYCADHYQSGAHHQLKTHLQAGSPVVMEMQIPATLV